MKAPRISRRRARELEARLAAMAQAAPLPARRAKTKLRDFDVRDFGAKGDSKTLDTAAFQAAIDAASAAGHARVLVRGGKRYLLGSLELKGGLDFHLADDAELLISTRRQDYTSAKAFLRAEGADGLRLSGTGRINGRGKEFMRRFDPVDEWWRPKQFRPRLFEFIACHGLEICDFTFGSAPAWGLHLLGCEQVLVDNLKIRNDLDLPNCDGIGPDHCRDVEIKRCDIVCGDDGVVIKATRQPIDFGPCARIVVKDCVLETQDSALKIGTETTQDIHDVRIERCAIRSSCRSFNIQLRDEGSVYNILVRDITFSSRFHSPPWWGRGEAFSLTAIPRTPETKIGSIHHVKLQNFRGRAENSGRVQGSPSSRPHDISLENIDLTLDRWTPYPGGMFDNRPTTVGIPLETHGTPAFSIREADNVKLDRCRAAWGGLAPDYFTHALEAENVTGLEIKKFTGAAAHPARDEAMRIH
jgi:hypothetical protein